MISVDDYADYLDGRVKAGAITASEASTILAQYRADVEEEEERKLLETDDGFPSYDNMDDE